MAVRPSVTLLDLMMPVMNDTKAASIPIAIVTAGHGIDRARSGDHGRVSVLHALRAGTERSA